MGKIKITQVKSSIDRSKKQKDTLFALGLRKMHQSVEHEANDQILGMVRKVDHLVITEEV
jgi:large subunit ribosomal protein L30